MTEEKDNVINLKEELFKYLAHWRWFILSVFVTLILAFLYLKFTPKSYSVATKILIKDEKSNDLANQLSAFSEMSMLGNSKNNIENEVEILKSRTLIYNTLDSLNLNIQYLDTSEVIEKDLYKKTPVQVLWNNDHITKTVFMKLTDIDGISFNFSVNGTKIGKTSFGKNISTEYGAFVVNKTGALNKLSQVKVNIFPKLQHAESYRNILSVAPASKTSSVIDVSIIDKTPEKAADF